MDFNSGLRWYLGRTHYGQERLAEENIDQQGMVAFLPQTLEQRRRGRRAELVPAPLFPRYLFIHADFSQGESYHPILSTRGIERLVEFSGRIAEVEPAIITAILDRMNDQGYVVLEEKPLPEFIEGESVRILQGSLAGQIGIFSRYANSEQRVLLLMELLGSQRSVSVDRANALPLRLETF